MLEIGTMDDADGVIEEVNALPELLAAKAKTTDPHGDEKLHHSAGRDRQSVADGSSDQYGSTD